MRSTGWDFIFLGADIDAVEISERMGMEPYAMTYDKRSRAGPQRGVRVDQ